MWELSNATRWVSGEAFHLGCREGIHSATTSLGVTESIICLQVVDGKLDSLNVNSEFTDILRSGSLPI